jgi:hypothetical protein
MRVQVSMHDSAVKDERYYHAHREAPGFNTHGTSEFRSVAR